MILSKLVYDIENSGKKALVRSYNIFISCFSLFLVSSAISKLMLYIKVYGLTLLRVYATWFLILTLLLLLLTCTKSFISKINLMKSLFAIFTVMFIGLNYFNVDYRIADYNSKLYKENTRDNLKVYMNLSLSSVEPFSKIKIASDYDTRERYDYILEHQKETIEKESKWQSWNLAKYKAEKVFYY